jgi:hypothetical protein
VDVIQPELVTIVSGDQPSILNLGTRFYSLELFFLYNLQNDDKPMNVETDKHSGIDWFNINQLPSKMIEIVKLGVENFNLNKNYGQYKH